MHRGHDHLAELDGATAGIGHNHPQSPKAIQWQRPHLAAETKVSDLAVQAESDLDLVEKAFSEGFSVTNDPTSFLRLAQVPFEGVTPDGKRLVLLRVETDAVADVGSVTPHLGGESFGYNPLPAAMVSRRQRLRFIYFDGQAPRALKLEEVRALQAPHADQPPP